MKFNFDIEMSSNFSSHNGIVFLNGSNPGKFSRQNYENLCYLLDTVGKLSSESQNLNSIITTGDKFFNSEQRIYLKCDGNIFIGFIKIGKKHLFIYDDIGKITEINPICVLDFYVYEKCQRNGFGKIIFEEMINRENIEPRKLGYDRPSRKFLNFLNKYYHLKDYVQQNNNFVVYKDYFYDDKKKNEIKNINNNYNIYKNNNYNNRNIDDNKKDNFTQDKVNNSENFRKLKVEIPKKQSTIQKIIRRREFNKNNENNNNILQTENNNYISSKNMNNYQSSSSDYGAFFYMK